MRSHDHRSPDAPIVGGGSRVSGAATAAGGGATSDPGADLAGGAGDRVLARVAMAGYLTPALAFYSRRLRSALGVEDRTASGEGWALTFDDGPHPRGTPAVLDALAEQGARATFFLVGEQVLRNPSLAGEIAGRGHQVALHCHRHRNLLRLGPRQVREDLARAAAAIEDATGVTPRLYRPPYGILNAEALRSARQAGRRTLLWTHWGRDWERRATPESIAERVTRAAGAGAVLLLHDADDYSAAGSWRRTAQALPRVLEAMAERGLQAVFP